MRISYSRSLPRSEGCGNKFDAEEPSLVTEFTTDGSSDESSGTAWHRAYYPLITRTSRIKANRSISMYNTFFSLAVHFATAWYAFTVRPFGMGAKKRKTKMVNLGSQLLRVTSLS